MSLEDEIQERLVADTESILEDNLDRVEKLFQLHTDGTINIHADYRDVGPENRILVYLVAQRFAMEGGVAEEQSLETEYFYERMDRANRTIRDDLQNLRDSGLVAKEGQTGHHIIVENLPEILDRIEEDADSADDES